MQQVSSQSFDNLASKSRSVTITHARINSLSQQKLICPSPYNELQRNVVI